MYWVFRRRRVSLANIVDHVISLSGGVTLEECNASEQPTPNSLQWLLDSKGAHVMSAEMTMRFVFLGVIAALFLIGFSMGNDGYRAPRGRGQSAAPEAGTSLGEARPSVASDAALATRFADEAIREDAAASDAICSSRR